MYFVPGYTYGLYCDGPIPGPKFLFGNRDGGYVQLFRDINTSLCFWRVHDAGNGNVALECEGGSEGPKWLNGVTGDGSVDLAPSIYSGAVWRVHDQVPPTPTNVQIAFVPRSHSRPQVAQWRYGRWQR